MKSQNINQGNLFSLIAPINKDSPSLFKWDNSFSWSYKGNIADSMKERVKSAGGNVDGVLRFSLQWNTQEENLNDYDAHCIEPDGNEIYFPSKGREHLSTGILDVDVVHPNMGIPAVENITWSSKHKMQIGKYVFYVNNFSHNGGTSGFDAEVDLDKKEAKLIINLFSVKPETKEFKTDIISVLSNIDSLIVSISGNKIDVKMDYDFGKMIPDKIWQMRENSFIEGFYDRHLTAQWERVCKETVLEYVKKLLPSVIEESEKMVNSLLEYWKSGNK